jgi:fumarate reductase flavoprotein subunit
MPKKKRKSRAWRKFFLAVLLVLTLTAIGRWSLQQERPEYPPLTRSVDVVVIGSGLAGSVAALSSAEAGADVYFVDLSGANSSGFPAFSPFFWAAGTPYQEEAELEYSPARMAQDIFTRGNEGGNLEQITALSEASAASMAWLESKTGMLFSRLPEPEGLPGLHLPSGGLAERLVLPALAKSLATQLAAYSDQLQPQKLLLAGGRVVGVVFFDGEGDEHTVLCRAVVLADGGIGGNTELLLAYTGQTGVTPRPEGGHSGTGIRLALEAGAIAEELERAPLLPVFLPEGRRFNLSGYPEALYLDSEGNELLPADTDMGSLISREGGIIFVIFGAEQEGIRDNFSLSADIQDLSAAIGVPAWKLQERLEGFAAPYSYAIVGVVALTPGGLATDSGFRVLGPDGPIEGLFAAGETAAGLHGGRVIADLFFTADTAGSFLAGRGAARLADR